MFCASVGSKLTPRILTVKPDQKAHFKIPLCRVIIKEPGLKHNNNFVSIVTALFTKKSEFMARCWNLYKSLVHNQYLLKSILIWNQLAHCKFFWRRLSWHLLSYTEFRHWSLGDNSWFLKVSREFIFTLELTAVIRIIMVGILFSELTTKVVHT